MTPFPPEGWTPVRVVSEGGDGPAVDWCWTAGVDGDDRFFDQAVERCLRDPSRLLFRHRTSMAALVERAAASPGLAPSGFVLHVSRCGSTLVTAMLAALPSTLVLSEPGPLDSALRTGRVDWLRAMLAALARRRHPEQVHCVVKLDAWAVLQLPVLLEAFPGVPWVFLRRDPIEVAVSQLRRRGWHAVPGSLPCGLLGLSPDEVWSMPPEDYVAAVIGSLWSAGTGALGSGRSLVVDHADLPGAVADLIAPHFGIPVDGAGRSAMAAVAGRDAKNPAVAWLDDTGAKQAAATPAVRAAVTRWVPR